ncbi:hypothetical protein L1987_13844 [Smallanthus sonchifolius]|uniref:Uncharacterized protein n=1 Tax=Smallanthus sonchifolius TaxID=185202 RepID=A0ACB9JI29_9ASTR|nr:hypothetical protein L1987_13844 [Smallanthus sonchifolius]
MAALKKILPPAKSSVTIFYDHSTEQWFKQRYSASIEDDDVYNSGPKTPVHDRGNLTFDAIGKRNEHAKKIVYSQHIDLIPKIQKDKEEEEEEDEKQKEIEKTTQQTKKVVGNVMLVAAQPKNVQTQSQDSKFIKYKQSAAFNSGAKERIIRMVEMQVDPLEHPKFKHKRIPKANGSPPVPLMHSPLTVKDQQDWKIPPCISNWKNSKGYTIPLDKRLAADGRGLQEVQINDNFAQLSEALYVAEQQAHEDVSMRSKFEKEMMMKEKEQELHALAQKARSERTCTGPTVDTDEPTRPEHEQRNKRGNDRDWDPPRETKEVREERLQREKITRDRDRDISEKVALGMASTGSARGSEVMYDQWLFNQEKGMDSGFATDDQYNVYDKGLFTVQPTLSTLYRPKKDADDLNCDGINRLCFCVLISFKRKQTARPYKYKEEEKAIHDDEMYGGADEQVEKNRTTDRFKPDKGFTGACEQSGPRERPVEFEREMAEDVDPFGLDQFITQVKGGKKPLDEIGSGGTMRASGGGSRHGYEGSGRTRIGFEKGR